MASLSSLFGVGTQQQQQPQAAAVTTQELPKQIAPYYEKLLKEAEALYKQKMEAGAPIYEGKTIAGYTPEQEQLFSGLQSLQGTQAPKFAEAEALTRGTTAKVTPDEVQEYMNPYQQAVVDIEKREAEKQYQSTVVPQLAAQAAAAGSFGGSRQGILEGMASEANQRLQADIQAKGSAQAYQDAMSLINQQRQREGAAAGQLAQLAPAGFAAQAQELGAIGKVGDAKQQQQQLALDEAYKQYMQEQQFPSESLKEYQSYVQSFPNIATQITRTPPPAQPSLAQTLIGGLGTAAGTYGAFGGFSPGGLFGMKNAETGGGISGLPVVKAQQNTFIQQKLRELEDRKKTNIAKSNQSIKDFFGGLFEGKPSPGLTRYQDKVKSLKDEFELGASEAYNKPYDELTSKEIADYKKILPTLDIKKDKSGLQSITSDPSQIAMIGPGLGDEGETVGTVMKIDPDTGKEDMSQLRVDKVGQPSEEFVRQQGFEPLPVEPQGEEDPKGEPGAKIDKIKAAKDKLNIPTTPDYRKMTDKESTLTEAQKQKLSDLKARQELAPQAMKESLFGTLAQLSSQYATDPDAKLLGKIGEFARIGGQQYQEGKAKQQALKEKITDTKIDLAKADVDLERYKDEKASKSDQVKFENIIKKEMYGLALTKSEQDWKKLNILDKEAYASLIKAQRTGLTKYSTLNKQKIQNYAGQFSGLKDTFINSNTLKNKAEEYNVSDKKLKKFMNNLERNISSSVGSKKYKPIMGNFIRYVERGLTGKDDMDTNAALQGMTEFVLSEFDKEFKPKG